MPKSKRCRCVVGNPSALALANGSPGQGGCHGSCMDVCSTPICGDPATLTLMAPVIYDQLGINLCSAVELTGLDGFTTATSASVQVIDITFGDGTEIDQVTGRANCYQVTLANLTVTFAIRLYDCCGRLLATLTETAVYLPPDTEDNYDEETNPDSVEFDIFAPYGIAYIDGDVETPLLNYIGFSSTNAVVNQGLNVTAYAKILNLDLDDAVATIGLTVYVMSIYHSQYQFTGVSRADVPKVSLVPEEDTLCQNFVDGDLLDLAIRPLELGSPQYEENLKIPCGKPCGGSNGGSCGGNSGCGCGGNSGGNNGGNNGSNNDCCTITPIENTSPTLPLTDDTAD